MNKNLKIFLSIFVFCFINTIFSTSTYANSNPSSDYTYIDCENGSDSEGVPFEHTKSYATLKRGVEASIAYINENGLTNPTGTGAAYTSYQFSIFVKPGCFFNGNDGNNVNLDFMGNDNNSTLLIAGLGGNFIVDNIYFNLTRPNSSNIHFRNVAFWRNDLIGFYFSGYTSRIFSTNSNGVKLYNCLININNGKHIMNFNDSYIGSRLRMNFYPGGYFIENSLINVSVSGDYNFRLPVYLKNNKIVFKNSSGTTNKYNIYFYPSGNNREGYNYGSINLLSNEIDMGGNNFYTDNTNSTYINNNFKNVGNFVLGTDETNTKYNTFINNQVSSINKPNITSNESVYNNVFLNGFIDSRDIDNFRRNFSSTTSEKGVGWVFKKQISSNLTLSMDYKSLYKEITGNDLSISSSNPLYIVVH